MKWPLLICFILLTTSAAAQTIPVFPEKGAVKNTPKKAKPAAAGKSNKAIPVPGENSVPDKTKQAGQVAATTPLILLPNTACHILLDGNDLGTANADTPIQANVSPGKHQIICKSTDGKDVLQREIDILSGEQKIITLDLLSVKNSKLQQTSAVLIAETDKGAEGSAERIENAINEGAGINVQLNKYGSLLIWALQFKKIELVHFLISKGIDINTENIKGETALCISIRERMFDIAKTLLGKGTSMKRGTTDANDPVFLAVKADLTEIVQLMNDRSIDWNTMPSDNKSPLYIAIDNKSAEMVGLLIDKGANPNYEALLTGSLIIEDLLPLSYSIQKNYSMDVIELLINRGANINRLYYNGHSSPMHVVARRNEPKLLQFFLGKGGKKDLFDYAGHTPLYYAAVADALKTAELLLKENAQLGADVSLNSITLSHDMKKLLRSYKVR